VADVHARLTSHVPEFAAAGLDGECATALVPVFPRTDGRREQHFLLAPRPGWLRQVCLAGVMGLAICVGADTFPCAKRGTGGGHDYSSSIGAAVARVCVMRDGSTGLSRLHLGAVSPALHACTEGRECGRVHWVCGKAMLRRMEDGWGRLQVHKVDTDVSI